MPTAVTEDVIKCSCPPLGIAVPSNKKRVGGGKGRENRRG